MKDDLREMKHMPRILTLDGGGVRGLSSLLILQKLMKEVEDLKKDGNVALPCKYFDLICGTSTGGLIAIMLGRLRLVCKSQVPKFNCQSVEECIKNYLKLSKSVFNLDNVKMGAVPVGANGCRFDEAKLEEALKKVISKVLGDENAPMADPNEGNPHFCPVFILATEGENATGPVKLFRSYGKEKDHCPIWQAARAASAAPTYFPPIYVKLPPPGGIYIDGGLRHNNPSEVALDEAREHWRASRCFFLVSIGTGIQKAADFIHNPEPPEESDTESGSSGNDMYPIADAEVGIFRRLRQVSGPIGSVMSKVRGGIKATASHLPLVDNTVKLSRVPGGLITLKRFAEELGKLSTNSEEVHKRMLGFAKAHDLYLRFPYYRFNVLSGLDEIGLQERKRKTKMGALTRGYLRDHNVKQEIERCAEGLVQKLSFEST